MKTNAKAKAISYMNVLIEDEGGLAIIRVSKKLLKAFSALHLLQLTAGGVPVKGMA